MEYASIRVPRFWHPQGSSNLVVQKQACMCTQHVNLGSEYTTIVLRGLFFYQSMNFTITCKYEIKIVMIWKKVKMLFLRLFYVTTYNLLLYKGWHPLGSFLKFRMQACMCTQHANLGSDYTADFDSPSLLAEKWGLSYEIVVLRGLFIYKYLICICYIFIAIN